MANNTPSVHNIPSIILQPWIHSWEEDRGDMQVYRPKNYPFPPARGRDGFEIKANGEFILSGPGRGDRPQQLIGSWVPEGANRIKINISVWGEDGRIMEFLFWDEKILKLRYLNLKAS